MLYFYSFAHLTKTHPESAPFLNQCMLEATVNKRSNIEIIQDKYDLKSNFEITFFAP